MKMNSRVLLLFGGLPPQPHPNTFFAGVGLIAIDLAGWKNIFLIPYHDSLGDNYGAIFNCLESTEVINPYASEEYYNVLTLINAW